MIGEIQKISINSRKYPQLLKQITDPPKQLYCRGNLDLFETFCFGVVGTRKLTSYGKEAAQYIVSFLTRAHFTIVSGLAIGVDAVAHQTTIDCDGKTIAVLGGGISDKTIGPKANLPLAKKILDNNGLLISEYSDKEEIRPMNFAARDRIISGVSKGILVVEAGEKSGALITAQCAVDQNRDVFAVPGNIFSSKSIGSHFLIKKGAKIVTSAEDILEEYGHNLSFFKNTKNSISTKDALEESILDILDKGFAFIDDIVRESGDDTPRVLAKLSMLEIKGIIKNIGNSKYKLNS